jgi:hypothetical protein
VLHEHIPSHRIKERANESDSERVAWQVSLLNEYALRVQADKTIEQGKQRICVQHFVIVACAKEVDKTYSALGIFEIIFF